MFIFTKKSKSECNKEISFFGFSGGLLILFVIFSSSIMFQNLSSLWGRALEVIVLLEDAHVRVDLSTNPAVSDCCQSKILSRTISRSTNS